MLLPLSTPVLRSGFPSLKEQDWLFPSILSGRNSLPLLPLQLTIERSRESSQGPCVLTNSELGNSGASISMPPQYMFCCEQRICCEECYGWTNTWSFAQWALSCLSLLLLELHIANHIWEKTVYFLSNCKITQYFIKIYFTYRYRHILILFYNNFKIVYFKFFLYAHMCLIYIHTYIYIMYIYIYNILNIFSLPHSASYLLGPSLIILFVPLNNFTSVFI